MASTRKTCPGCRRRFTPRRGTRRQFCYECRPERSKAASEPVPAVAEPAGRVDGPMTAAVRAELERAGQVGKVSAAAALRLAIAVDDPGLAPAQVASLIAKLLAVMEPLSKLGPREPDELDEFSSRLAAKRASA